MHRLGGWSLALLLLAGCERSSPLVPASGRVLLGGRPLAKATVTLLPESTPGARAAVALTGDDGTFAVRTGNFAGAVPGHYKVVVGKDEPGAAPAAAETTNPAPDGEPKLIGKATREELGSGMQAATRFPVHSVIPERYAHPRQSPLECEVPAGGVRTLLLELDEAH